MIIECVVIGWSLVEQLMLKASIAFLFIQNLGLSDVTAYFHGTSVGGGASDFALKRFFSRSTQLYAFDATLCVRREFRRHFLPM